MPGRECGGCTVCCTVKAIVSDELIKPPQTPCLHCTGTACAIYDHRPRVCAGYQCGWRFLPWIPEDLRPDRALVMFDPLREPPAGYAQAVSILAFDQLAALRSQAVRKVVVLLIENKVAVYFAKSGAPGALVDLVFANDALAPAVAAKDEDALSAALERVWRALAAVDGLASGRRGWQHAPRGL